MSCVARKKVAWLCLGALLSLQLAVAAYACQTGMDDSGAPMFVSGVPASQIDHGMDKGNPKLCEQHCVQASRSVESRPHSLYAPVLSLAVVVFQSDLHRSVILPSQGVRPRTAVELLPLVRFGVLRI